MDLKPSAAMERLVEVVRELRRKCPWDRAQSLASLGRYFIEEAYETAEAFSEGSSTEIADELGDILGQVLLAAAIAEDTGLFTLEQLCDQASNKLVRRHPHVFGQTSAESVDEVIANWERIKVSERKNAGASSAIDGVSRGLPALMRAEKLAKRARGAGMDWADIHAVLAKVREEMDEIEGALASNDPDAAAEEIGDALLALGNAPRFIGYDSEATLHAACNKFERRFRLTEQKATARGLTLSEMDEAAQEQLWREAKEALAESSGD